MGPGYFLSFFFIYHPSAYISRDHSHEFVIASHDISFFYTFVGQLQLFFSYSFLFFVAFSYFLSYFLLLFSFLDEIKKSIV